MKKQFFSLALLLFTLLSCSSYAQYCGTSSASIPLTPISYYGLGDPSSYRCLTQGRQDTVDISFKCYTSFTAQGNTVNIYGLRIDSIENLPCGVCWSTSSPTNEFQPNAFGTIRITGLTAAQAGQYKMRIIMSVNTQNQSTYDITRIDAALGGIYSYVRVKSSTGTCAAVDTTQPSLIGCGSSSILATVTAAAPDVCPGDSTLLSANAGTGYTYHWSTGQTTRTIYGGEGTYVVTVTSGTDSAVSMPAYIGRSHNCSGLWNSSYFENCEASTSTATTQAGTAPGLRPAADQVACLINGQAAHQLIYFKNYYSSGIVAVDSVKIDSIYLPKGLCWSTNKAYNKFAAGEDGVIEISGTPVGPAGQYNLHIVGQIWQQGSYYPHEDLGNDMFLRYGLRIACPARSCAPYNYRDSLLGFISAGDTCGNMPVLTVTTSGPSTFCQNDFVILSADSGAGYTYVWSTGETSRQIIARSTGSYTVTFYAAGNFLGTATVPVTVNPLPTAGFTLMPDPATPHNWIAVNQSVGTNYTWTWGDNSPTGTGATPSHTYDSAGTYTICVYVSNQYGCQAHYCDSGYMYKTDAQMIGLTVVQYTLGISDANAQQVRMKYYAGAIHFSESITTPSDITLYDMSGRVVMSRRAWTGTVLPVDASLSDGVYITTLQNNATTLSGRIGIVR